MVEPETPEEFEERMDLISELLELTRDMEVSILATLDTLKEAVTKQGQLLLKIGDLTERG